MKKSIVVLMVFALVLSCFGLPAFAEEVDNPVNEPIEPAPYSTGESYIYTDNWRTVCTQVNYDRNVKVQNTGSSIGAIRLIMYTTWSPTTVIYTDTVYAGEVKTYFVGSDVTKVMITAVYGPTTGIVSW